MDQLSRLSDHLVLAAMALLSFSLLAHAVELVLRRSVNRRQGSRDHRLTPAAADAGHSEWSGTAPPPLEAQPGSNDQPPVDASQPRAVEVAGRAATTLAAFAIALTCAALAVRGLAAGRAPWGNMYEFGLAAAAAMGVTYLVTLRRHPVRLLGLWMIALLLTLLGVSYTLLHTPADELVPVLRSTWLVVHVAAAIVAGGLFAMGAVATGVSFVLDRRDRRGPTGGDPERTAVFQNVAHTMHLVAFPLWTFAVIAGAIWAENAWGRYWGWDPKETWAFITWVFYAAHLHALSTSGWRRRAGVLALLGFAAYVFNFFGVNIWLPGLHSYAGV